MSAYVAERVALVKAGDPQPMDLRLTDGEVLRFQCTVLPAGGRMLSYTAVTDIVRRTDELEYLHAALDNVKDGVIVLDSDLHARYMNRIIRELWQLSEADAARRPHYSELIRIGRRIGLLPPPPEGDEAYIARSIALVRIDDPNPVDFQVRDRTIRGRCAPLAGRRAHPDLRRHLGPDPARTTVADAGDDRRTDRLAQPHRRRQPAARRRQVCRGVVHGARWSAAAPSGRHSEA